MTGIALIDWLKTPTFAYQLTKLLTIYLWGCIGELGIWKIVFFQCLNINNVVSALFLRIQILISWEVENEPRPFIFFLHQKSHYLNELLIIFILYKFHSNLPAEVAILVQVLSKI